MLRRTLLFGVAAALDAASAPETPAAGKLLIATTKSHDPELGKSVVLLMHYDRQGAIGLMVNRRVSGSMYTGGPVPLGVNALLRSAKRLKSAMNLFGDVYLISDRVFIEATANAGAPASVFRVYSGYTGWSFEQLRNEVAAGLWRVARADAGLVFDPHPETLWQRLAPR